MVRLHEMRPDHSTGAHQTGLLAELVCSNSLGSALPDRATGVLRRELSDLGALLVRCARETAVPAGGALAVDRNAFARLVTERIEQHPRIQVVREEVTVLPESDCILASGPLTSDALANALAQFTGEEQLFFFDAIAPIIREESIDMSVAFRASRYDRGATGAGDYINCPLNREEYYTFIEHLSKARRIPLRAFDQLVEQGVKAGMHRFFEGCLPVEILARRGEQALAFGPMRPVGLTDPRTGRRPYAVLQLRQDNLAGSLFNMVGFQTNLTYTEQERVFRMIPGLAHAEFERYGQMHRNTFLAAPALLHGTLQTRKRDHLLVAGQLTGVEGYMGNIGTGWLAGTNAARLAHDQEPLVLPREMMLGALCHYITHADPADFQPMKANFGIMPTLEMTRRLKKREKAQAYAERSRQAVAKLVDTI